MAASSGDDSKRLDLFERIYPLSANERVRALAAVRAENPEVAAEVEALLAAEAEGQFTGHDLVAFRSGWDQNGGAEDEEPAAIGPFRVLRRLGQGGMGVVFECEQEAPRRRVAVKVLRSFGVDADAASRFRREADLLALLEHPGIARVYSAGVAETPTGPCHWLAMELVEGLDPLSFAAQHQMGVAERCELMAKVCDAVHHAHQRGVVHRDLKPGNLLIAGPSSAEAQPKVLDFGVARVVQGDGVLGRSTLLTQLTQTGQIVGTLAYMSPEQLEGDPDAVDHRSDIYALGVLAYELLAGKPPIDVSSVTFPVAVRMIQDRLPPRLGKVVPGLRGDVEVVIGHALEKEPWLRYGSVATFAQDLRNLAGDRPILARPASGWQQMRRFTRRHRGLVAGVVGLFVLVTAGLLVFANLARENKNLAGRERQQREQADLARRDLRRALYRSQMNLASSLLGSVSGIAQSRPFTGDWIPTDAETEDIRGFEWYLLRALGHSETLSVPRERHQPFVFGPKGDVLVGLGPGTVRYDALSGKHLGGRPMSANVFADSEASFGLLIRSTSIETIEFEGGLIGRGQIGNAHLGYVPTATGIGPQGTYAAAAGMIDGQSVLDLFDLPKLEPLGRIKLPTRVQYEIEFSPDGRYLVAPGASRDAFVVSTRPLQLERTLPTVRAGPFRFRSDGRFLAAGSPTPVVQVWSTDTWDVVRRLPAPSPTVLEWRPDGQWLAMGGRDRSLRLVPVFRDAGHLLLGVQDVGMFGADWDPDGERVLAYSSDVRVYSPDRAPLRLFPVSSDVRSLWFREDGRLLQVADGGTLRTWSVDEQREVGSEPGGLWSVSHDGRLEAVIRGKSCTIRSAEDQSVVAEHAFSFDILRAAWSPVANHLLVGGYVEQAHTEIWRWEIGQEPAKVLRAGQLADMLWRRDGHHALVVTRPGRITEFDVRTGSSRATEPVLQNPTRLARSPDGFEIVGGDYTGDFRVIREDMSVGPRIDAHSGTLLDFAWSPDGTRLTTAGADRLVRIWDTTTWESMLSLPHPANVTKVAWSADGTRLATACLDGLLRVWDSRGARDE